MGFPPNKTKIVCTIGPASGSTQIMEKMIPAGANVARLNFSHGDFASHGKVIKALRNLWAGVLPLWQISRAPRCESGSWRKEQGVEGDLVVLTEGPSSKHPEANNRMEIPPPLSCQRGAIGDSSDLGVPILALCEKCWG